MAAAALRSCSMPDQMSCGVAARLMARLTEIQRDFRIPRSRSPVDRRGPTETRRERPNSAVDWSRVELWWGDERLCQLMMSATPSKPLISLRRRWHSTGSDP